MIGTVVLIIIALCAIFVYLDASANGIGDISGYRRKFDKSAMFWAIGTIFVWPFVFPYYLSMRSKLIEAAADHSVVEKWRWLKASGVTLLAAGFVAASVALPV